MKLVKTLICKNTCAPSDTYNNGFSIDFIDENLNQYFVEYSNIKKQTYDFKKNHKYKIEFSCKIIEGLLNFKSYKMTRIKVLQENII